MLRSLSSVKTRIMKTETKNLQSFRCKLDIEKTHGLEHFNANSLALHEGKCSRVHYFELLGL
jgi:hypothetical protein